MLKVEQALRVLTVATLLATFAVPAALVWLVAFLEISFLDTSLMIWQLSPLIDPVAALHFLNPYLGMSGAAFQPGISIRANEINWDLRCLEFAVASFALLVVCFRKSGMGKALLKGVRAMGLILIPLPVEVYFFDNQQFGDHVMMMLENTPLSWFTNALLLSTLLVGVLSTTALLGTRREV